MHAAARLAIVRGVKFRTLLLGHHDDHAKQRIGEALDRMEPKSRLDTVMSIQPEEQRVLWKLCEGNSIGFEHFVPSGTDPMKEVIHHGRNSLLAHNFFQKRFARGEGEENDLFGYNEQSWGWITGPGYFVAHATAEEKSPPGDYVIDYTRIPPKKPDAWPEIIPNEARLGRFVYAGMKDYMRRVSEHVSIGRAYKKGKPMNAWFILCREDAPSA
jgi:hypothetical protein